jgi:hypothetical protein
VISLAPNLDDFPQIGEPQFQWLRNNGVPVQTLIDLDLRTINGVKAEDGRFEQGDGASWIILPEECDLVFWQPKSGEISTALGRVFAVGQDAAQNEWACAMGGSLSIFETPLDWLRASCKGIVVLDWSLAFERLRDVPRISVPEKLAITYQRHMKPARLPKFSIVKDDTKMEARA